MSHLFHVGPHFLFLLLFCFCCGGGPCSSGQLHFGWSPLAVCHDVQTALHIVSNSTDHLAIWMKCCCSIFKYKVQSNQTLSLKFWLSLWRVQICWAASYRELHSTSLFANKAVIGVNKTLNLEEEMTMFKLLNIKYFLNLKKIHPWELFLHCSVLRGSFPAKASW